MDKAEIKVRVVFHAEPIKERIISVAKEFADKTQPNAAKDDQLRETLRILFLMLEQVNK